MTNLILLLLLGFILLIKGAGWLVDGSIITARKLNVSPLIIGLTIVAFGTSAPELVVNVISALNEDAAGIGLGNIIGSNIANIGLILGASGLIFPLLVKKSTTTREIPFMVFSGAVFLVLVGDKILNTGKENVLNLTDGIVLLLFFAIFLYYMAYSVFRGKTGKVAEEFAKEYDHHKQVKTSWTKTAIITAAGMAGIIFGGQLVVQNGAEIARLLGVSDILIGLTVIAVGTSLPELSTSLVAAMKKEPDIAVGNIVGSNIFNTFFILGINAVISPIPFEATLFMDLLLMVALSALLYMMSLSNGKITRSEGFSLLLIYIGYITFTIIRG